MFEFYNPHPQQKIVEDCVKRAFTKASGKTYQEVTNELNRIKRAQGASKYNVNSVWKEYVEKNLNGKKMSFPAVKGQPRMNGARFCMEYSAGTYVLNMAGHLSCCVDGVIYDTWDCREKCVYTAYEIPKEVDNVEIKLVVNGGACHYHEDAVDLETSTSGSAMIPMPGTESQDWGKKHWSDEEEEMPLIACEAMNDAENKRVDKSAGEMVMHYPGNVIIDSLSKITGLPVQITKKKQEHWIQLTLETYPAVLNELLHNKDYQHLNWKTRRGSTKSTILDEKTGMTLVLWGGNNPSIFCIKN